MIKVGKAKGVITPKETRHYHDLYARALVFNDGTKRLVILTYDLVDLTRTTPILRERCKRELGIDKAHLIPIATHTESCPLTRLDSSSTYCAWLANRLFTLIKQAIADEEGPAQIYFNCGHVYFACNTDFFHKENDGKEPVDNEVQVVKVTIKQKPVAFLFNYPCHSADSCISYIFKNRSMRNIGGLASFDGKKWVHRRGVCFGADFPGFATDEIEKRIPTAIAMFGDSCGGNQGVVEPEGINSSIEMMKHYGYELAKEVLQVASGPMKEVTGDIQSQFDVLHLPLAKPITYRKALNLLRNAPPDRAGNWIRALVKHYQEEIAFPMTYSGVQDLPDQPGCEVEEIIVTKIGSMVLVAMQGEVCAAIGMRIKDALRPKVPTMVFAYMGEHNVYIPTRRLVEIGATYQARVVCTQYGSPCWWAPEVEDKTVEGVLNLVSQLNQNKRRKNVQEREAN